MLHERRAEDSEPCLSVIDGGGHEVRLGLAISICDLQFKITICDLKTR
jgi:hypothetical protein